VGVRESSESASTPRGSPPSRPHRHAGAA
jgi:hypothetical protein